MATIFYVFTFDESINLDEVRASLVLATMAVESLHGEAQAQLDMAYQFDDAKFQCLIDANTAVGRDLNRVFAGFLRREFTPDSFCVERRPV